MDGRTELLQRLGRVLEANPKYFGREGTTECRPGHVVDFLLQRAEQAADGTCTVSVHVLWEAVIEGLQDMWPATRTKLRGVNMGDVWPHRCVVDGRSLRRFHLAAPLLPSTPRVTHTLDCLSRGVLATEYAQHNLLYYWLAGKRLAP